MGDRIVVFDRGRIIQVGSPIDLVLNPATLFVARFVGTPPMNLLPCVIASEDGSLRLRGAGWSLALPSEITDLVSLSNPVGSTVTLAVRPQYLEWSYEPWPDFNLEVVVDVVEPVGTEEIVHCRFGDAELQGLFPLFGGLREGERAYLHFALENALVFTGTDDEARRLL